MSSSSPSGQRSIRPPHPLTERLISRLRNLDRAVTPSNTPRVLEIGTGSGRNAAALTAAGFTYAGIPDGDIKAAIHHVTHRHDLFHAALATHSFLHGTSLQIAHLLDATVAQLEPGGLLYATFGSTRDARFGKGERLGTHTFAPTDGDERGVPHSYFDERSLRKLLEKHFAIERLDEVGVDTIAGTWAHATAPLHNAVHWFVEAIIVSRSDRA